MSGSCFGCDHSSSKSLPRDIAGVSHSTYFGTRLKTVPPSLDVVYVALGMSIRAHVQLNSPRPAELFCQLATRPKGALACGAVFTDVVISPGMRCIGQA